MTRALRGQSAWTVLVLHLSRLAPPAPRAHHRRIARAVLDDAATRYQGQLFTLANGDLALLFSPADRGAGLAASLANLFAADAPDASLLLSRWPLPQYLAELVAFLDALPLLAAAPSSVEQESGLAAVQMLFNAVEPGRIPDLLLRQTGVLVTSGGSERLLPVFREIRFSMPALEARAASLGHVTADPFLFRHLIAKLDPAMLAATTADLATTRPLLAGVRGGPLALHMNMSVETVLSPGFAALVEAAEATHTQVAIEIAQLEAFADTGAFLRARARVAEAGFALVLDDVSHHSLLVTKPVQLGYDWLKLEWSRQIMQGGTGLQQALERLDVANVILLKADTEEAVRWGLTRGIRRFQGRHTDAILAAGRLATCPSAGLCTLRRCIEREGGATPAARVGCNNHALLDTSVRDAEPVA